ncbi:MAG: glycogen/starch/alpha-glucan phosphorylase [Candidatus Caldarchaeum sp.]|nr:glycogen/starch/alpha-glucan phosphorylase [Candidatus Caldarchaeum sp.]
MIVSITPELGLDEAPVYAGGLGILEADKFYAAASMGLSYTVLTFFYPRGYVYYQPSDDGFIQIRQEIYPEKLTAEDEIVFVSNFLGEKIAVRPYFFKLGNAKAVFFHVISPERAARTIQRLYVYDKPDSRELFAIILAKASSIYIRDRIGVEKVEFLDLQESLGSLTAFLLPELRNKIRFVVHTIAPWINFGVNPESIKKEIPEADLSKYGSSLYYLSMEKATQVFAVSAKHERLVKQVTQSYDGKISHVTNGVNLQRWTHPEIQRLIKNNRLLSVEDFASARLKMRSELVDLLKKTKPDIRVDSDDFLVAWPRRMSKYKRPYFVERLVREVADDFSVVFVLGGKAHPFDGDGQYFMKQFRKLHQEYPKVVYFHDYDVAKAKTILSSVDLLLFTPFSGWEACGTSYMKAGVNGTPTLSSRDGGALEVIRDGYNGWFFGRELDELVNIYADHQKTSEVDEFDYADLIRKFVEIAKMYRERPDEYLQIQLNALTSMRDACDITKTMTKYYPFSHRISSADV